MTVLYRPGRQRPRPGARWAHTKSGAAPPVTASLVFRRRALVRLLEARRRAKALWAFTKTPAAAAASLVFSARRPRRPEPVPGRKRVAAPPFSKRKSLLALPARLPVAVAKQARRAVRFAFTKRKSLVVAAEFLRVVAVALRKRPKPWAPTKTPAAPAVAASLLWKRPRRFEPVAFVLRKLRRWLRWLPGISGPGRRDVDGNSVLVPTLGIRHAADSLRNAELSFETRAEADRFLARFALRRASDDRARGMVHRVRIERRRAGEAGGISHLVLSLSPAEPTLHEAADSTARLDNEGHSLVPAKLRLRHAPDSLRAFDLLAHDGGKQDRTRYVFAAVPRAAMVHRIRLERWRAGEAGGVRVVVLDAAVVSVGERIPAAEGTGRLDGNGDSVIPPSLHLRHSPDSLRSADLVGADGDKQDRFRQRFVVGRTAIRHRVRIERRRAGEAGGIRALAIDYEAVTDGTTRITGEVAV